MVDLCAHLDGASAVFGTIGSGKTFAAKGGVEGLLEQGRRVVVIDPTGAWHGMRSGADGDPDGGFDVTIFGGEHADINITEKSGKLLAETIANRHMQCIIDTSEFTQGEKVRFLTPFLETLYARTDRRPLHLIVDEADEIAAQKLADGEQRMFGAFDKIVRRGRIKGFRVLMITQRPAVLHKNVLSQIQTLVMMKLVSPQDRKAVEDWVRGAADADAAKQVIPTLSGLQVGEGWIWAPGQGVLEHGVFPVIRTYDSSRTPEYGDEAPSVRLKPVDLLDLQDALNQQAEDLPKTEVKPTRETADLRTELKRVSSQLKAAEDRVEHEFHRGFAAAMADVSLYAKNRKPAGSAPSRKPITAPVKKGKMPSKAEDTSLPAGARKMLAFLQERPVLRLSWSSLAASVGNKARGGNFNRCRKALLESGEIAEENGLVRLAAQSGDQWESMPPRELLESWKKILPSRAADILGLLAEGETSRVEIARRLGLAPSGGNWNSLWKVLKDNELVSVSGNRAEIAPELAIEWGMK
jgi:hypothetical protein